MIKSSIPMPPIEETVKPAKKSAAPLLFGLLLVAVLGVLVAFLITLLNQQAQLKTQVSGLKNELASQSTVNRQPATGDQPVADAAPAAGQPSANQPTTNQITPATWATSPSKPAQTHPVEKGETLFSIGQKYSIEWINLVKANGLANENLIKAGDILVIPTVDAKTSLNQVEFTVEADKAKTIQQSAISSQPWRLDPVEVAKKEGSGVYGLALNDQWVLGNKNNETGQATVRVAQGDKQYEITLTQPVDKGEQGIWAVTMVKPVK